MMATDTDKAPQRSGKIRCGACGKDVITGTWVKLMFCPDAKCINSEENYFN